jgi:hypothetical protein
MRYGSSPESDSELLRSFTLVGEFLGLGEGVGFFRRLVPVVVIGLLGLLFFDAGSTTTTNFIGQSSVEVGRVGALGACLIALAVALLFGNGTFRSIARVARGNGGFLDVTSAQGSVIAALIAIAAAAASAFCFFMFLTGFGVSG